MILRLERAADRPRGEVLAEGQGRVGGLRYALSLTAEELHFRIAGGPAYAVDLLAVTEAAMAAITADLSTTTTPN